MINVHVQASFYSAFRQVLVEKGKRALLLEKVYDYVKYVNVKTHRH